MACLCHEATWGTPHVTPTCEDDAPPVSLMSAKTNFHRRGLAELTLGEGYLSARSVGTRETESRVYVGCSNGIKRVQDGHFNKFKGKGKGTEAAVKQEETPWEQAFGPGTAAAAALRPWTAQRFLACLQKRISCLLFSSTGSSHCRRATSKGCKQ